MSTGFRTEGEVTIADLVGDIAGKGALDLNRKLNDILNKTGSTGQVLVNLERCLGLDLVALRVLANASKELVHRRDGSFGMVKVSATIREQLISAALLHRFEIFDDEEEGVRQFSNRRWASRTSRGTPSSVDTAGLGATSSASCGRRVSSVSSWMLTRTRSPWRAISTARPSRVTVPRRIS
ncbi:MAG: STAS domain-containing protein [Candidatus Poribacteria bacterium]